MGMETAAAILTKLAFEQNEELKSKLKAAQGKEKDFAALMVPLFRQILSELDKNQQTYEKFPSAIPTSSPTSSPDRSDKGPQSKAGTNKEIQKEGRSQEDKDIGGEG